MKPINEMRLKFDSRSVNESFGRAAVAAFAAQLDPNIEELSDIRTAVSEAVTNAIVHGYDQKEGIVYLECFSYDNTVMVSVPGMLQSMGSQLTKTCR